MNVMTSPRSLSAAMRHFTVHVSDGLQSTVSTDSFGRTLRLLRDSEAPALREPEFYSGIIDALTEIQLDVQLR